MNKLLLYFSIAASLIFLGCATSYQPKYTGLELQAFQRQEFETSKSIAFKSVMSVFQDMGYTIESADLETGFITAKSPTTDGIGFMVNVMRDTKATAHIETLREGITSIRLTFLNRREDSGAYGTKRERSTPVEDQTVYQNAFSRIREAIFIREGVD